MHKNTGILFVLAVSMLLFGCPSEGDGQPTDITDGGAPQAPAMFSGGALNEGNLSVCAVITAENAEDALGLAPDSLYRGNSFISHSEIMLNNCGYKVSDSLRPGMSIGYTYYGPGASYGGSAPLEGGAEPVNTSEGEVGGYEYLYVEYAYGDQTLFVMIPQERILLEISCVFDFPASGEENLKKIASLFLSKVDFSDNSPHQLTPPSLQTSTYKGSIISFQYPSNWEVDKQHDYADMVNLRDSDGIEVLYVGQNTLEVYSGVQDFEADLQESRDKGVEILNGSVEYNEDGTITYTYIGMKNGAASIVQYTSPDAQNTSSLFAMGLIVGEERYSLYEEAILGVLSSLKKNS